MADRLRVASCAGIVIGAGAALLASGAVWARAAVGADEKAPSAAAVTVAVASPERLVGFWKLNPELSEDPRAKMREGGGGRGPGGWSGGRGGGGAEGGGFGGGPPGGRGGSGGPGGFGGGRHGGYGGEGGGAPGDVGFSQPIAFNSRLTVTNLTPEITMIDPEGAVRRLHADNKRYKDSDGDEVKARWVEAGLVVETKTRRGNVRETWSVAPGEPRRLTVVVRVDRPYGGPVTVKRVFDPDEPDGSGTPAP